MNSYEEILSAMTQKYEELTGFHPDNASDVGIRMKTLAYQIYSLAYSLEELEKQLFPQTAQGSYLDKHARQRGLVRKEGQKAAGTIVFIRNSLSQGEIVIPAGTIVSTTGENPVLYQTTQEVFLAMGQGEAQASIVAAEAGTKGNAAPMAVKLLVTPISGVSQAHNPKGITGGVDPEGDEELRSRLLESYRNISNGSNAAYYMQEALACPGVGYAGILPRSRGRGTVDVVVWGEQGAPDSGLLEELKNRLAAKREVNVDIQVRAAEIRTPGVAVEIAWEQGYDLQSLKPACQEALEEYFNFLTVGQPLYQSALTALLIKIPGVANCKVTVTGGDVYPLENQIIRLGSLSITAMAVTGG